MFLSPVSMILLLALAVLTSADPLCDPETQYLHKGECCQKCKPGTSMVSMGECRNPACRDCEENEYMDKYNTEQMCERQPYCDPNSNFVWPGSTSTTKRHQCQCNQGFHCSSSSCTTCVPHTECGRGHGATTIGDQTHDTVCAPCPNGTFSDEKSWNGTCKKKTTCEYGIKANEGSSESDHICEPEPNGVPIIGIVFGVLGGVAAIAVVAYRIYKCRRKGQTGRGLQKVPIETDATDYARDQDEEKGNLVIAIPTENMELRMPTEETTPPSEATEETRDGVRTDNGYLLSQDGKEHITSQQETQAGY